jgi:orotidine-5'-phosphate decarboxylase
VETAAVRNRSRLCVGLDPEPARFPARFADLEDAIFQFNQAIIDATADLVCAYKPQIAHYSAVAAEQDLTRTIEYIHETTEVPVILDAKRGDIGSTAEMYARELFDRYGADAATVNPYLGLDAMKPYLDRADRGVLILCSTSYPGGGDLQNLSLASGRTLYEEVAYQALQRWNYNNNVLLVVGATRPQELARIREIVGKMPLLLPGVGVQGADLREMVKSAGGGGMIVNASRAVIYAGDGEDFADRARATAVQIRDAINQHAGELGISLY